MGRGACRPGPIPGRGVIAFRFQRGRPALLLLALLASCNSGGDAPGHAGDAPRSPTVAAPSQTHRASDLVVDIDATKASAPIRLVVGQALRIRLPASPASGFDWTIDGDLPAFLRVETAPGQEPARAPAPQTWSFRACQRGRGQVRFLRRQPWDAGAASARQETLDIVAD